MMNLPPQPPKWAAKLLERLCPDEVLEEIQGDLQELFEEQVEEAGVQQARREYVLAVLGYCRPFAFKKHKSKHAKPLYTDMIYNYFIIALRNFSRNKVYSFLNVCGLACGLAVSLLILLFVAHEKSYDRFHSHARQLFKLSGKITYGAQEINIDGGFTPAVAPALKQADPDVVSYVRFSGSYDHQLIGRETTSTSFYEDKWLFADSSFFSVFSFRLLSGNRRTALSQPNTVVITPEIARKYFGNENPIGKTLSFHRKPNPFFENTTDSKPIPFTITGIIEPAPSNSSITYNFIASFQSLSSVDKNQYDFSQLGLGNCPTFLRLRSEEKAAKVQHSLNKLVPAMNEQMKQQLSLHKLTDLHLNGPATESTEKYIHIFWGVACLILILALINYISLTTARATQRAKEVGIRKVIGAARTQLIYQFFGESFLMVLIAFAIACMVIALALPAFYQIIGITIPLRFLLQPELISIALAILLISGLIAGSYPALLLSSLLPVTVLKGKFTSAKGGALLRRLFTVFQFSASTALIIWSLVMQQQLAFMRNKDIGMDKERLLVIPVEGKNVGESYQAFRDELQKQTGVQQVAVSTSIPFKGMNMMFSETPTHDRISLYFNNVDENFIATLGIEWKVKPVRSDVFKKGKNQIILNEKAAEKLGLGENPLGKFIPFSKDQCEVVGIVKDFNYASLQYAISPLALLPVADTTVTKMMNLGGYLTVRFHPQADLPGKIADFGNIYKKYESGKPFEYFFLDETFNKLYTYQDRLANVSHLFTGFAILISCLGLFGLAAFTAERRTKEIGIRKVLGANIPTIFSLLTKDLVLLVLLAFLIAAPVAWYTTYQWLQNFAYQINLSLWIFLGAGITAISLALLTVSFHAIKAAIANPVDALRNE